MIKFLSRLFGSKPDIGKKTGMQKFKEANHLIANGLGVLDACGRVGLENSYYYQLRKKYGTRKSGNRPSGGNRYTNEQVDSITADIKSGTPVVVACAKIGMATNSYWTRMKRRKGPSQPSASVATPIHPRRLPVPRPVGGDKEVWDALMNAPKKPAAPFNLIHIYAVLNDVHWLSLRDVCEKLGELALPSNISGNLNGLFRKGYIEVSKKDSEHRKNLTHYRRKVPFHTQQRILHSLSELSTANGEKH